MHILGKDLYEDLSLLREDRTWEAWSKLFRNESWHRGDINHLLYEGEPTKSGLLLIIVRCGDNESLEAEQEEAFKALEEKNPTDYDWWLIILHVKRLRKKILQTISKRGKEAIYGLLSCIIGEPGKINTNRDLGEEVVKFFLEQKEKINSHFVAFLLVLLIEHVECLRDRLAEELLKEQCFNEKEYRALLTTIIRFVKDKTLLQATIWKLKEKALSYIEMAAIETYVDIESLDDKSLKAELKNQSVNTYKPSKEEIISTVQDVNEHLEKVKLMALLRRFLQLKPTIEDVRQILQKLEFYMRMEFIEMFLELEPDKSQLCRIVDYLEENVEFPHDEYINLYRGEKWFMQKWNSLKDKIRKSLRAQQLVGEELLPLVCSGGDAGKRAAYDFLEFLKRTSHDKETMQVLIQKGLIHNFIISVDDETMKEEASSILFEHDNSNWNLCFIIVRVTSLREKFLPILKQRVPEGNGPGRDEFHYLINNMKIMDEDDGSILEELKSIYERTTPEILNIPASNSTIP